MDKLRNPKKANDAKTALKKSATMHNRSKSVTDDPLNDASQGDHDVALPMHERAGEKPVQQLVKEAEDTHKDTTRTAQRALNVIEQTKHVKNSMLESLHDQNKHLENVDHELETMNDQLSYSQRILLYMGRCCGCITWMCDCCTGADPEAQKIREYERRARMESKRQLRFDSEAVDKQAAAYNGAPPPDKKVLVPSATFNSGTMGDDDDFKPQLRSVQSDRFNQGYAEGEETSSNRINFREIDVTMPKGYEKAGMNLAEESRKQNELIDQIGSGLQELLSGAKVIQEELQKQDRFIDKLENKTEGTKVRLSEINNKSMLRKYK